MQEPITPQTDEEQQIYEAHLQRAYNDLKFLRAVVNIKEEIEAHDAYTRPEKLADIFATLEGITEFNGEGIGDARETALFQALERVEHGLLTRQVIASILMRLFDFKGDSTS